MNLLDDRLLTEPTLLSSATGSFTSLSVPLALFYKNWSKTLASQCFQLTMVFSSHPLEIVGSVLNGFLVTRFLSVEGSTLVQKRKEILKEAVEVCIQAEMEYESSFKLFENEWMVKSKNAFSHTLQGLINQIEKPEKEVLQWIVENSNVYSNREIRYASQGFVLSLMLLALYWILNRESNFSLSSILRQGRETEKLGALVGAWTGALQGAQAIPENLKTGLVNGREISLRGDALFHRRMKKNAKVLVNMEMALTNKETEEGKRYLPKETRKVLKSINIDSWEDDEDIVPTKENRAQWRKFQKEKTKAKRDRRKNLPSEFF